MTELAIIARTFCQILSENCQITPPGNGDAVLIDDGDDYFVASSLGTCWRRSGNRATVSISSS